METVETQWGKPLFLTAFLIASVFAGLAWEMASGTLANTDELLTAERSREMLTLGRSEVHFNFEPSFEKPPLQYWLTGFSLQTLKNRTFAVRIWPLVYLVLTAICAGWLAFLLEPSRPWVVPLSVALLISCPLFCKEAWHHSLDIGLAFFITAAFASAQLARRHSVWWLGVGMACWLGSLQKVPQVALIWLLILIIRLISPNERLLLGYRWLFPSLVSAAVLCSIWPAVQILNYGMSFRSVYQQEIVDWLGSKYLASRPYLEIPYRLSVTSASGIFLLIAPFAALFWRKQNFTQPIKEISIVSLAFIGLAVITNFRSVRYIVPVIPTLCLVLAIVIHRLLERKGSVRALAAGLAAVLLLEGFIQTTLDIQYNRKDVAIEKRVAEELGALQEEGMRTVLINARDEGASLLYDSFYLFHGNLRFPVTKLTVDQIRRAPPPPPVLGVCIDRDFTALHEVYSNPRVQFTLGQFIIWRAD
jgi:4-amino-4-deoxy-L-arabinose transferase-like glycosyltransferase